MTEPRVATLALALVCALLQAPQVRADERAAATRPALRQVQLRESASMTEVLAAADAQTLVVFDIDNTLIEPEGQLGSDQWFYYLMRLQQMQGLTEEQARERALAVWNSAQARVQLRPVEAHTPALLRELQGRGVRTMAMTARAPTMAERTLAQLDAVGISFAGHAPDTGRRALALRVGPQRLRARYQAGVLFVGEVGHKGQALAALLRRLNLRPARVLFVDDKQHHVEGVGHTLGKLGVRYLGFRYGATDAKVAAFQALVTEVDSVDTAELLFLGRAPAPAAASPRRD